MSDKVLMDLMTVPHTENTQPKLIGDVPPYETCCLSGPTLMDDGHDDSPRAENMDCII